MTIAVRTVEKSLIDRAVEIIDKVSRNSVVAIAYSGGKDSTVLALLFEEWLRNGGEPKKVYLVHNDTLGEINMVEFWAREFMDLWAKRISNLGFSPEIVITTPPAKDTFLWRMIVRGYAAPTFKWRWCVDLLKINPTFRVLKGLVQSYGNVKLLVGLRRDESSARAKAMINRKLESPNKIFTNALLKSELKNVDKISPIADWIESDVWTYILERTKDVPELRKLIKLYWAEGCKANCTSSPASARFGCWFCTVAEKHRGLENVISMLDERFTWFEYLRNLIRDISDSEFLRRKKNWGYSKLGPLTYCARSIILKALEVVEEESGVKIYGLDEARVNGATLREIFYEIEPKTANELIRSVDKTPRARVFDIGKLRELNKACSNEELLKLMKRAREGSEQILRKIL